MTQDTAVPGHAVEAPQDPIKARRLERDTTTVPRALLPRLCEGRRYDFGQELDPLQELCEARDLPENRSGLRKVRAELDARCALLDCLGWWGDADRDVEVPSALVHVLHDGVRIEVRDLRERVEVARGDLKQAPNDPERILHLGESETDLEAMVAFLATLDRQEAGREDTAGADSVPLTDEDRATLRCVIDHRVVATVADFSDPADASVEALEVAERQFRWMASLLRAIERGRLVVAEIPRTLGLLRVTQLRMEDALANEDDEDAVILVPATRWQIAQVEELIARLEGETGDSR
ncbi:MAG TPA: hypothetical protein VGY30_10695 [Solirubrobacteraceae bacterium]|jgi:hypothetical protein|nr:hypothetical protein [Solirubrobacteraceae bacterium]